MPGCDEVRRLIREQEPPRPSTRISTMGKAATTVSEHRRTNPVELSNSLRHELDWIVMKALEKDRTRRYQTANDFARDIQRYLDDEPVEACPPSTVIPPEEIRAPPQDRRPGDGSCGFGLDPGRWRGCGTSVPRNQGGEAGGRTTADRQRTAAAGQRAGCNWLRSRSDWRKKRLSVKASCGRKPSNATQQAEGGPQAGGNSHRLSGGSYFAAPTRRRTDGRSR